MRLCAIVLILNFQLAHIFAHPPDSHELSSQANNDQKGYECGDVFFTDNEVKEVLTVARASIDQEYLFPQRYQGKLYVESEFEEYFLYPIRKGPLFRPQTEDVKTAFRVVLTRNSDEAVDVIARIPIGDFTKCIKRGNTNIVPSHSVPEIPNGYLCGHEFFTDETISQNLALAQREVEGKSNNLRPYIGRMYPKHIGYLMWPLKKAEVLYQSREDRIRPYQLILSKERKIVDVVVKGYNKILLSCIRSRKAPKAPASDQYSKLFVPPPRYGYVCSKKIFDDVVLEETAKTLQNQATKSIKNNIIKYFGPPFNQPCLIWPLLQSGKLFQGGRKGPYRLILTPEYKIISVSMHANGIYKACERNIIKANKNHDTSNFHCSQEIFTHQQLLRSAEEACVRMKSLRKYNFPANYDGPGFEKEGPYLTFPVIGKGVFKKHPGLSRVVINTNCEVVGALTTLRDDYFKRLVKCHRLADGPLPPGFFGANAQTVFEFRLKIN